MIILLLNWEHETSIFNIHGDYNYFKSNLIIIQWINIPPPNKLFWSWDICRHLLLFLSKQIWYQGCYVTRDICLYRHTGWQLEMGRLISHHISGILKKKRRELGGEGLNLGNLLRKQRWLDGGVNLHQKGEVYMICTLMLTHLSFYIDFDIPRKKVQTLLSITKFQGY